MGQSQHEVSSCCKAPLIRKELSDPSNFSDDDYDLKVLIWVCSRCHSIVYRKTAKGDQADATT